VERQEGRHGKWERLRIDWLKRVSAENVYHLHGGLSGVVLRRPRHISGVSDCESMLHRGLQWGDSAADRQFRVPVAVGYVNGLRQPRQRVAVCRGWQARLAKNIGAHVLGSEAQILNPTLGGGGCGPRLKAARYLGGDACPKKETGLPQLKQSEERLQEGGDFRTRHALRKSLSIEIPWERALRPPQWGWVRKKACDTLVEDENKPPRGLAAQPVQVWSGLW